MRTFVLPLLFGAFVACASQPTPPPQEPVSTTETTAVALPAPSTNETTVVLQEPSRVTIETTAESTPPPRSEAPQSGVGMVEPTAAVRMACNLPDQPSEAPRFAYRSSDLRSRDKDILHEVGVCLTTGPLAGKQVCITGHTDPRGSTAYNHGLGLARGYAAMHYLERFGVKPEQTSIASAGETKAHGQDDAGWARDRRVEIDLADAPDSPCRGQAGD